MTDATKAARAASLANMKAQIATNASDLQALHSPEVAMALRNMRAEIRRQGMEPLR